MSDEMRKLEAIEGGDLEKDQDDYFNLMNESFEKMFAALKYDR